MASRKLEDLSTAFRGFAVDFLARSRDAGFDLLVVCTRRSYAEQIALWEIGRTVAGSILTYAKPGHSLHETGDAIDVVILVNGKPYWKTDKAGLILWNRLGAIGEQCGLDWSGRWPAKVREYGHFQLRKK